MKKYLTIYFAFFCLLAGAQIKTLTPGEIAPDIKLLNINGKVVSFNDFPSSKGFIIVFTCNTCPYSKAYEQRIIELDKKYASLGFPVIAINPNDPNASQGDSFEKMKQRAKSSKYTFPYLYDKGQMVTSLYEPKNTPYVFIVSKTKEGNIIEYTGAIDNDTQDTNPDKIKYVEDAISALINNKKPAISVTKGIGCRISWKKTT
jgi:thiol-disulfide isomerase/thioredoxin